MSWFTIVENIRLHKCRQHQQYGSCGCRSKRKMRNPCNYAESFAISAEKLSFGEQAEHSIQQIYDYMKHRVCHNVGCNHRRCAINRQCLQFLQDQMYQQKAA